MTIIINHDHDNDENSDDEDNHGGDDVFLLL